MILEGSPDRVNEDFRESHDGATPVIAASPDPSGIPPRRKTWSEISSGWYFDYIPHELKELRRWAVYRREVRPDGSPVKAIYNAYRLDRKARINAPSTYQQFDQAVSEYCWGRKLGSI